MHGISRLEVVLDDIVAGGAAWANPWLRGGANTLIGAAALGLLVRSVPLGQLGQHLQPRHFSPLLGIVALTLLSQLARAARWTLLLRGRAQVGLIEALWINAATGLANYMLPLRTGEALRLWWLTRRGRQPAAAGLGLIVADHAFDLGGVTAVLAAGTVLKATGGSQLPALPALSVVLGLALAALIAIAGGAWLGPRLVARGPLQRAVRRSWGAAVARHSLAFWGALGSVSRRRLAVMLAASAVAVGLDGLAFALLFVALGLAVPVASAVVAQVTLLFTYLVPSAPGYVGSLEVGGTLLLTSIDLTPGDAAGAIVLWHALATMTVVGLGAVALSRVLRAGQQTP